MTALPLDHVASDIHRAPHGSESSRQVNPRRKNRGVSPLAPVTGDGDQRLAERMRDRDLRGRWRLHSVEARPALGNLEPTRRRLGQGLVDALPLLVVDELLPHCGADDGARVCCQSGKVRCKALQVPSRRRCGSDGVSRFATPLLDRLGERQRATTQAGRRNRDIIGRD